MNARVTAGIAMPTHHLPDDALLEQAAGTLDPAFRLAVACHLALCARCRTERQRLVELGGAILDAEAPHPLDDALLSRLMARLDDQPDAVTGPVTVTAPETPDKIVLPRELLPFTPPPPLARALSGLPHPRWRYVAPGTRGIDLPTGSDAATAHLFRLRPGLEIPRHDHGAVEATVVFTGALLDDGQRFGPGDVLFRAPGETHTQTIEPGATCIALVVNAGRLKPLTWKGRLVKLIARP